MNILLFLTIFFWNGFIESFLTQFPALASISLHVSNLVIFVNDLESENRLDNILECQDAAEATVVVDDDGNLGFLLEHLIEDIADRSERAPYPGCYRQFCLRPGLRAG